MLNMYEDRVTWDDLSPSLQQKLISLVEDTILKEINNSNSAIAKALYNSILKAITNETNSGNGSLYQSIVNAINKALSQQINSGSGDLYNNIVNAVTQAITKQLGGGGGSGSSSSLLDAINSAVNAAVSNALSNSNSSLYSAMQQYVSKIISNALDGTDTTSTLYTTIRGMMQTNLPPKIGYLDDVYVPIQGTYNMSYGLNSGPFYISDAEGRENLFFCASNTSYSSLAIVGLYRATRMISTEPWAYDNNALRPGFLESISGYVKSNNGPLYDSIRVNAIIALGSEFILLQLTNGKRVIALTQSSGSAKNWKNFFYVDGTVLNTSCIERITYNGNVYYVTSTTDNSLVATTTDPVNGVSRTANGKCYLNIYKVVENAATTHTPTVTLIRTDQIYTAEYKYNVNGDKLCWKNCNPLTVTYLKHMNCIMLYTCVSYALYQYMNDAAKSTVTWSHNTSKVHDYLMVSKPNLGTFLTSTTNHYAQNASNYKLGMNFMHTSANQWGITWSSPTGQVTYDELKRQLAIITNQSREWGGTPGSSYLSIYNLDNDAVINEFYQCAQANLHSTTFPWYYPNGNTYPNLQKAMENNNTVIQSSDTAPWSKNILHAFFYKDKMALYGSSKALGYSHVNMVPTLLTNPNTGAVYSKDIFTCAVGKWKKINGVNNDVWGSRVIAYRPNGSSTTSEISWWIGSTKVRFAKTYTDTYEDGSSDTVFGYFHEYDEQDVGFTNIDPLTILKNHFASEISSHALTVNSFQEQYQVYVNTGTFGKAYITYGLLRIKITNTNGVYKYSGNGGSDTNLKSMLPCIIVHTQSGTTTVYELVDFTWYNSNQVQDNTWKNNMLSNIRDGNITYGRTQSGYLEGSNRNQAFLDHNGQLVLGILFHKTDMDSYSGPNMMVVDIPNKKVYAGLRYIESVWGQHRYGYSNALGYFYVDQCYSYSWLRILCSKDYLAPSPGTNYTSTMLSVLSNGSYYSKLMYTSSSVGNIAYLSSTVIYLGGYFSELKAAEIYLNNGDNYVYIRRDSNSYNITIEVYDHLIGVPGDSQFNRILCCLIKVSNNLIYSQTDYEVNYYNII